MRAKSFGSFMASSAGRYLAVALVVGVAAALAPAPAHAASKAEQQKEIRAMASETLARLYKAQPAAKKAIQGAAGYAVFSNFGMKILFAGGGKGEGSAVDTKSKKETFMKMIEAQAGLGMEIKKFRVGWVVETTTALDQFVNSGWELGGQMGAAAKVGDEGLAAAGAMSISPGVWLYQLTDEGLATEITAKGTKYYKDDDLN